jgi:hypothetical protein
MKTVTFKSLSVAQTLVQEPLVFSSEEQRRAEKYVNDKLITYTAQAIAQAFGFPSVPPNDDPRIQAISATTLLSSQQVVYTLLWIASTLGVTVNACLHQIDKNGATLESMAYCAYATKHWEAKDRAPLQALAEIPK